MSDEAILTYQTRLTLDERPSKILSEYANLFNKVEHSLYAEIASGKTSASCKNDFLKKYGITARQFNACRVSLEGKVAGCKAGQEQAIISLKQQIDALCKKIQYLEKKPSKHFTLHQKMRRKHHLSSRLINLERDLEEGRVRLCFGGKKLFRAQFYLKQNGFSSHQEWKETWEAKRQSEFFVLGSKDETAGNQTCTARLQENGQLVLRLRLPNVLAKKYGKYLEIENVSFAYGQEAILASLNHPNGQAISYRFKKDKKSWRIFGGLQVKRWLRMNAEAASDVLCSSALAKARASSQIASSATSAFNLSSLLTCKPPFASTNLKKTEPISREGNGVIGIDLNTDHIACIETDRFGNPVHRKVIPWVSYGKSKGQLQAITGNICKQIVERAKETKKPLVIEKLDFIKKKTTLAEKGENKFSRLLSSFAYGLFFVFLIARAFKNGIAVHQINPAFTSIIGRVNYAMRYGLSIHLAAALCIARRYQEFSEAPCSPTEKIPDGKGGHVAFVLPVRNRTKHVWHFWGQVKKKLSTVLAAHFRAIHNRSSSPSNPTLEIDDPDRYWCDSNT